MGKKITLQTDNSESKPKHLAHANLREYRTLTVSLANFSSFKQSAATF